MSRFFSAPGDSSSSSEEDEESSDEEVQQQMIVPKSGTAGGLKSGAAAFMKGDDDDDSDDDSKRVVRSHRDKKWDQMREAADEIKNHVKINDWLQISADFDKLNKMLVKAATIVQREGVPSFYLQALLYIDDSLGKTQEKLRDDKDAKKKMSSSNAKALNSMKQKLRKTMKAYESELAALKENQGGNEKEEGSADESEEEESDDGFTTVQSKSSKAAAFAKSGADDGFTTVGKKGAKQEKKGPKKIEDYNELNAKVSPDLSA